MQYQNEEKALQEQADAFTVRCSRISFWRGITFAAGIVLLCAGWQQNSSLLYLGSAVFFTAFLLLIRYHSRLEAEQRRLSCRQSVVGDYLARFGNAWKDFPITGERYQNDDFPEIKDLDIFGKGSLYQYICTSSTIFGQDQLAVWLRQPDKAPEQIRNRQQAAAELAGKSEFSMEFETAARGLRTIGYDASKKIMAGFFQSLEEHNPVWPVLDTVRKAAIRLFPAMTLAFLLLAVLGCSRPLTASGFLLLAGFQLLSALIGMRWNDRLLAPVYRLNQIIAPYEELLKNLEQEAFESAYLKELQQDILRKGSASAALKELEAIAGAVVMRHNLLAAA